MPAGIYDPDFIAANQEERADNLIKGSKSEQVETVRSQIRAFKEANAVDQVVILWTANTERYAGVVEGLNDTAENMMASIERNETEISPSTLYAVASVLEGVPFVNGSPQNTFVPGMIDLATQKNVLIGGDDFKSGQTKLKSVLVDFLVGAGLKPTSIVSYNHLGNNDGMNLSAPQTFRSKEISKSNVVDDMVASNAILYAPGEHPDHVVVIKYVPYVGDSKRAMDEYTSEIFMGGKNTLVIHNTCEVRMMRRRMGRRQGRMHAPGWPPQWQGAKCTENSKRRSAAALYQLCLPEGRGARNMQAGGAMCVQYRAVCASSQTTCTACTRAV